MGEWNAYIHIFLTSALVGGEWSTSPPGRYILGIRWIRGWVGPRTGLDAVENRKILPLPGHELRPLGLPTSSQSRSRLILTSADEEHLAMYSLISVADGKYYLLECNAV
jgi:hypothetical protein